MHSNSLNAKRKEWVIMAQPIIPYVNADNVELERRKEMAAKVGA